MPRIRDYPEAETLESTDAFVIDRDGVGTMYVETGALSASVSASIDRCLTLIIDGGGSELSTGIAGALYLPFAVELGSVTLLADQSGSVEIDISTGLYSAYPTGASIVGSAPPTITTATKGQDTTLTGWTTTIPADSFLQFSVTSVTDITRLTIALEAVG